MNLDYVQAIDRSTQTMRNILQGFAPKIGLILGSGLGDIAHHIEQPIVIEYKQLSDFPVSTVEGHAGRWVAGMFEQQPVIMMQGRFHYYEGYSMKQIVMPVYVMKQLGVQVLIVTNAAGGMNRAYQPGDLMLICDHINFTGDHPLRGIHHRELGERFPDLSEAYSMRLRRLAKQIAAQMVNRDELPIRVQEGVYVGISGPSYLTASELHMLHRLGGDALGMSTVPEVIAARHASLEVLGISCITDRATGDASEPLTHEQVISIANQTKPMFMEWVRRIVRQL